MAITEWTDKIHECQKGEVQREYCYLNQYYSFYGNLREFADLLKYAYNKNVKKTQGNIEEIFEDYLEEHTICFHPDDVRKGCPPTYKQLGNWSNGQNTNCNITYNWEDRRSSKRNEVNRLADENIAAKVTDLMPYILNEVVKGLKETDDAVEFSKAIGNFTPHQAESATKSRAHVVDSLQKITGKDKNYNVKADVDSKNTVEYKGVDNLLEAFHASKAEWDKHKES